MKITGRVLTIIGGLMILLNVMGWLGAPKNNLPGPDAPPVNVVAYYIGFNLFLIIGSILLLIGLRLRKKARQQKAREELLNDFLSDPPKN